MKATPSSAGPLCWLGVLGPTVDVSFLKESSLWDCCWAGCGSLERQSGTRFALPARHRKLISYSSRLRADLCSFGSRLRLRNSHVSAEQSVTKVKRLPAMYCLKSLMAHRTVMHFRSVGPRRESVFEKRWFGTKSMGMSRQKKYGWCDQKLVITNGPTRPKEGGPTHGSACHTVVLIWVENGLPHGNSPILQKRRFNLIDHDPSYLSICVIPKTTCLGPQTSRQEQEEL